MPFDVLALDFESARRSDTDGRLHVAISHISKVAVNPYRGSEIPDAEALGLDPDRVYQLFRAPEELARSVPTWNRIQVLIKHTPVSADDPNHDVVVGTLGDNASFDAPYLNNSLTVWDGKAIAAIESGAQRQLSGGYHYRADMRSGTYMGQRFDGVMRDIVGNHVALVEAGRAGADVMVMDEAMREIATERNPIMSKKAAIFSPRTAVAMGALQIYLPPKMGKDQEIPDLNRLLAGASTMKDIASRVTRATQGRLAQDASLEDLSAVLDALKPSAPELVPEAAAAPGPEMLPPDADAPPVDNLDPGPIDPEHTNPNAEDDDIEEKVRQLLEGKLDDADLEMLLKLIRPEETSEDPPAPIDQSDEPPPDKADAPPTAMTPPPKNDDRDPAKDNGLPRPGGAMDRKPPALTKENQVDKPAMDAAIRVASERAVADAIKQTTDRLNARADAERFVRPWIGEVQIAMDTAADVYRFALDTMKVPTKDVHPSAFKAMLTLVPRPGDAMPRPARMAADAAANTSLMERFPALKNARVAG
jgi:hypothetical protein